MGKRILNCVVLSTINRPGVMYRWIRRFYFNRLFKRIETLPERVRKINGQSRLTSRQKVFF